MGKSEVCRSCGRKLSGQTKENNPWYPFCSQRCRWVDLGKWFDQEYRLSEGKSASLEANSDKSRGK